MKFTTGKYVEVNGTKFYQGERVQVVSKSGQGYVGRIIDIDDNSIHLNVIGISWDIQAFFDTIEYIGRAG
ncbi:hypothetical protein [Bacillus paranthracis]|uniref:hypothetical protein n=1 Tax=Bacillus paranthracis TaxID=2026186 RepID=UPI0022E94D7B|nr:hypothetical protein [Bacillus paranthracis]